MGLVVAGLASVVVLGGGESGVLTLATLSVVLRVILVALGLLRLLIGALRGLVARKQIVEVIGTARGHLRRALSQVIIDELLGEVRLTLHQIVAHSLHRLRRVICNIATDVRLLSHV